MWVAHAVRLYVGDVGLLLLYTASRLETAIGCAADVSHSRMGTVMVLPWHLLLIIKAVIYAVKNFLFQGGVECGGVGGLQVVGTAPLTQPLGPADLFKGAEACDAFIPKGGLTRLGGVHRPARRDGAGLNPRVSPGGT